jgi:hypothetical protein
MRRRERGGRRHAIVLRVAGTWIPSIKRFLLHAMKRLMCGRS